MKPELFQDIISRTGGDIYLGIVGPVRTGKSTFIKKFMDLLVLPNIEDSQLLERTKDELPQGSAGRTIMTTEPKFIPDDAIEVKLSENITMRVRLVDCVGYAVRGAWGYNDGDAKRMVSTPWFEEPVSFEEAAEVGTRKVIDEHSTIGVVVTTDGSITDIPRENYVEAEERVINELKELKKPFVVILNSTNPYSPQTVKLKDEISEKHEVPVVAVNCVELTEDDINALLKEVLYEFPVQEININLPKWVEVLDQSHWAVQKYTEIIKEYLFKIDRLRDIEPSLQGMKEHELIFDAVAAEIELGSGSAFIEILAPQDLYESILSEICGTEIKDEADLIKVLREFAYAKKEYDKVSDALEKVKQDGYGIVPPLIDQITLEEPEIIRQGGRFGVRLRASAPSLHLIKVDIKADFTPVVGTEKQSEDLVNYLMEEYSESPERLWESNLFGKSLYELVTDDISSKLENMPPNAQNKLQETMEKVINEGSGGIIVIIL